MRAAAGEGGAATRAQAPGGMFLGILAVAAFSLSLPLTRAAVPYVGAVGVTVFRAVVAGVASLLFLAVTRAPLPTAAQWRELAVVAAGVVVGFPLFSGLAMGRAPAGHGAIVVGLVPLGTALVGSRLEASRLGPRFWAGSLGGSATVAAFALRHGEGRLALADALLVVAVVGAAVGYAFGGRLSRELGGARVICWALVACLPLSVPMVAVVGSSALQASPPSVLAALAYLALVSQLGAFFLWNRALAVGGIARVSQTQLIQPFLTLAASAWLLGEPLQPGMIVFAALVIACVAFGRSTGAGGAKEEKGTSK